MPCQCHFFPPAITIIWAITVTIAITDYEFDDSTHNSALQPSIQGVHPIVFQLPHLNNRLNSVITQFYSPQQQTRRWLLLHLVDKGEDMSAVLKASFRQPVPTLFCIIDLYKTHKHGIVRHCCSTIKPAAVIWWRAICATCQWRTSNLLHSKLDTNTAVLHLHMSDFGTPSCYKMAH